MPENPTQRRPVEVLDTTLRDGSYKVNFGFSVRDTSILTQALDRLGFPYIEVGHGVGIGASRKLPGEVAAESDEAYIAAARKAARRAEIASFCVAGIVELDDIDRAADAGLQIVRVGANADQYRNLAPYVEHSLKRGMKAMANLMKCYLLTPAEIGAAARACGEMGACAFYVVDSAGAMVPDDVTASVQAASLATDVAIGFHGHNNLGLAIANSLCAIDAGATLLDGTLLGIGRCSGNAPTEILVSLLQRIHGQCQDIDRQLVMQLADEAVRPILDRSGCEGSVVTAYGLGGVHSSFSSAIEKLASERDLSLYSLIEEIGTLDRSRISPDVLNRAADRAKHRNRLHETVGATNLLLSAGHGEND